MATYLYYCEVHKEMELEHSVDKKIHWCPKCKEENLPKSKLTRLIAGGTNFILAGGGWAKDNYSSNK